MEGINIEDLERLVMEFCKRYLFPVLNDASEKGENPYIMNMALLECFRMMLEVNAPTPDNAILAFEQITRSYVEDWREKISGDRGTPH